MEGQLTFIRKAPIYHQSLSCTWEECPSCHGRNHLSKREANRSGEWFTVYLDACPDCGQPLLWDWDEIDRIAKKTPDYIKAEKAHPEGGPV